MSFSVVRSARIRERLPTAVYGILPLTCSSPLLIFLVEHHLIPHLLRCAVGSPAFSSLHSFSLSSNPSEYSRRHAADCLFVHPPFCCFVFVIYLLCVRSSSAIQHPALVVA